MASKKCPKCGEDNPAEAVMCWACYTPLSGSAAAIPAAAGALGAKGPVGNAPIGVPGGAGEETEKKKIDPKMIGVGAFLVVGGLIAFLVNGGMGGSSEGEEEGKDPAPATTDNGNIPAPVTQPGGVAPPVASGPAISGGPPPAPVPLPFTTVTSPNPQYATGTVGILIAADKTGQAAGFARFAKDQLARNGRWQNMQVCVFSDKATADAFDAYQGKRRGAPLTNADYSQLAARGVWNTTPVFYESRGKQDRVYFPSRNPNSWWPKR